jgi:Mg-chelatase subunit ChlD
MDRSGSMGAIEREMESALQSFVEAHSKVPSTRLSYVRFDGSDPQDIVFQDVPVNSVQRNLLKIKPRGTTPLIDALCLAIDRTGARYSSMDESDRPDQVLFVVITDGLENCSSKFTREELKTRINRQTNTYNWQFTYLGANQDAIAEAGKLSLNIGTSITFNPKRINETFAALNDTTISYVSNTTRGDSLKEYNKNQRKMALGE